MHFENIHWWHSQSVVFFLRGFFCDLKIIFWKFRSYTRLIFSWKRKKKMLTTGKFAGRCYVGRDGDFAAAFLSLALALVSDAIFAARRKTRRAARHGSAPSYPWRVSIARGGGSFTVSGTSGLIRRAESRGNRARARSPLASPSPTRTLGALKFNKVSTRAALTRRRVLNTTNIDTIRSLLPNISISWYRVDANRDKIKVSAAVMNERSN